MSFRYMRMVLDVYFFILLSTMFMKLVVLYFLSKVFWDLLLHLLCYTKLGRFIEIYWWLHF